MSLTENAKVDHDLLSSVVSPFTRFHQSAGRNVLKTAVNFSSYSNSGFSTTIYPPSSSTIIDKRMLLQATVSVTTTAANSLIEGAPRAWPLASVMSSLQITVNGNSTTSQPKELVYFLQRFNADGLFRSKYWSMTPSQPDPCNSYAKCPRAINPPGTPSIQLRAAQADTTLINSYVTVPAIDYPDIPVNWSPFCEEFYFKGDNECNRASFPVSVNGAGTVNTYTFCEPILHSLCSDSEVEGLTNVRELGIQIVFDNNLLRLFSKPSAVVGGAVNLVASPPRLLISYFEPEDVSQIPMTVSLPYTQHVIKNLSLNALPNAPSTRSFYNLVLGQVPNKMYIFARPSNSALSTELADGFACVEGLNMTIGNRSGILASASSHQLYQMSVSNGLQMTWKEYSRRVGSVVCIDVANDIGSLTPGALGNVSISFDITLSNRVFLDRDIDDPANVWAGNWDLYFVAELSGEYKISSDMAQLSLGLSVADMVEAESVEPLDLGDVKKDGAGFGGSMAGWRKFYRGLKKAVRGVNRVAQKVAQAPGMDSNPYVMGAAKIIQQTENMMHAKDRQPVATAEALKVAAGMRGKGLLRM